MEITHNNKIYRWMGDSWGLLFVNNLKMDGSTVTFWTNTSWDLPSMKVDTHHTPEQLVKLGYLEEVKENKELPAGAIGKLDDTYIFPTPDHSILEKLREWVDKELKLDGYEHKQILDKIDFLTSIETPPISKEETTQFTPGQPQEDIELLPHFKIGTGSFAGRFEEAIGKQVELLTIAVNQLIDNKK